MMDPTKETLEEAKQWIDSALIKASAIDRAVPSVNLHDLIEDVSNCRELIDAALAIIEDTEDVE